MNETTRRVVICLTRVLLPAPLAALHAAENPLTVEPRRLQDIAVLETIVDGETVYRKGDTEEHPGTSHLNHP